MRYNKAFPSLLLLLVASVADAQERQGRSLASGYGGGPSLGGDHVSISDGGEVRFTRHTSSGSQVYSFNSAVPVPGAYDVVGSSAVSGLLVAGRNANGGLLNYWEWSASLDTWVLSDSLSVPGCDFCGVTCVAGSLYLMDAVTASILRAVWSPGTLPLAASGLSVFVTEGEVPGLADADSLTLMPLDQGSAPNLPGPGAFVCMRGLDPIGQRGTLIRESLGVPSVSAYVFDPFPVSEFAVVHEEDVRAGEMELSVSAPAGLVFEIRKPDGVAIGSGVGSPTSQDVVVGLTEPLAVGVVYSVVGIGANYGTSFKCLARYGFPEVLADGTRVSRIMIPAVEAVVDNPGFSISAPIERDSAGPRVSYSSLMILGFQGMPILMVDNGQGPNCLLDSQYWVGAGGFIAENATAGFVRMSFPIPDNPSLAGIVFLGQFVIGDAIGLRLGEVIGFEIGPALPQ